jgi:hypothetical protein
MGGSALLYREPFQDVSVSVGFLMLELRTLEGNGAGANGDQLPGTIAERELLSLYERAGSKHPAYDPKRFGAPRRLMTHDGGWECLLLIPLGGASEEPTDRSDRVPTAVSSTTPSQARGHI